MNIRKTTTIFIFVTILAIAVYDVCAFNIGGTEGTISWTMFEWAYKYPVFPFAMGFVMGHLFWQMKPQLKLDSAKKDGR